MVTMGLIAFLACGECYMAVKNTSISVFSPFTIGILTIAYHLMK
jgi:hypothetical protein